MIFFNQKHYYSLAATGIKFKDRYFSTREMAKAEMYRYMSKHGLRVKEVYDDKHYKTYICGEVRFYINREL